MSRYKLQKWHMLLMESDGFESSGKWETERKQKEK